MEEVLLDILERLRAGEAMDDAQVARILAHYNRQAGAPVRAFAKKHLAPFYLGVKANDPARWEGWRVDAELEARLLALLRMKPRRTASGVATITVITKPWPCANDCLYCPNDVRMPKSYLHDEPACQRAERNCFDPYLQVASRLRALHDMGHITDKVELIVLGGTWSDYPRGYQIWFAQQLFAALNDDDDKRSANATARRRAYEQAGSTRCGIATDADQLQAQCAPWQAEIDAGRLSYSEAVAGLYGASPAWREVSRWQTATLEDLFREHRANETAAHRVVGLVVETRPDTVNAESLRLIRQLGATKLQMGVQSLDPAVLAANSRTARSAATEGRLSPADEVQPTAHAIDLARLFGFKVHTHFMVNLLGATPEGDKADYERFATWTPYQPDEVKIYPCALVAGTGLQACYDDGTWRPYTEEELLDVLVADTLATPEFTRVSRMIRDISAGDILAGNKKANLRQLVEARAQESGRPIREMRYRELNAADVDLEKLALRETRYDTRSTHEVFLQWVTPDDRIAGFLRLSLPDAGVVASLPELPVLPGQAMIREVHVYGRVAGIGEAGVCPTKADTGEEPTDATPGSIGRTSDRSEVNENPHQPCEAAGASAKPNAQHAGLGRRLVQRACDIALREGYREINVISAIGTREYYRKLGFRDGDLYLTKRLS